MLGPLKRIGRSSTDNKRSVDGLCSIEQFHRALEKERCRSDRSDHQYSLMVFALPNGTQTTEGFQKAVRRIRKRIRTLDEIGWYDEKHVGIILPYTSREGAKTLAGEICEIISPCLTKDSCLECEIYCYAPNDAANGNLPEI